MMPKFYFMNGECGFTTLMIGDDWMDEVLQTLIKIAYNEGYTDGSQDNIRDNRARPRGGNATA